MPYTTHYRKPRVFYGSSVEGLPIARAVLGNLEHDVLGRLWTNAFPLSSSTIDSLLGELKETDFGVFILSDDDIVKMRGTDFVVSRDNVLFEVGLSVGYLGKLRTFMVSPRDVKEFHIPTDMLGVTLTTYDSSRIKTEKMTNALVSATNDIRSAINTSLWNKLKITATVRVDDYDPNKLKFKNKILIKFFNEERFSIRLELLEATIDKFKIDPEHPLYGDGYTYPPVFVDNKNGIEFYTRIRVIPANTQVQIFIPISPAIPRSDLDNQLKLMSTGTLNIKYEPLIPASAIFDKTLLF